MFQSSDKHYLSQSRPPDPIQNQPATFTVILKYETFLSGFCDFSLSIIHRRTDGRTDRRTDAQTYKHTDGHFYKDSDGV